MIAPRDFIYEGIPWKDGGRSRETGVDCAGLAALFLREECGLKFDAPPVKPPMGCRELLRPISSYFSGKMFERGDLVFFESKGEVRHVAVCIGENRWLHILRGYPSRLDNGFALLLRLGMKPCGYLRADESEKLAAALSDPKLGETVATVVLIVISILASVASALLAPKLGRLGNKYGRYGFDALVTQNTPEVPLPDLLGSVVVAGNSPYTQQKEAGAGGTAASQKANKIVVLGSAPFEEIDYQTGLKINGLAWNDAFFKNGSLVEGIYVDPAQTKAEAVTGTIGGDSNVPSVSLYTGAYGITVPVDVRAQYDREFPVYGLSGSSYLVFRLIDSSKFQNFNVTCRVNGRKCRTFDDSGFITATATAEALTGADGSKVRFKLAFEDIAEVTSLEVDGDPFAQISAAAQTGDVYQLNRTKGYVEFLTAPTGGATIEITYTYYVRAWSQNPAVELVYLLTESRRGMGFDGSQIDWEAADALQDYCDASVTWHSANGPVTEPRYVSNYAIDFRKPIQEHIKAVLDSCNAGLFLSGGLFVMKARGVDSSVMSFTTGNIVADSFASELLERTERANRVKLLFHSDEAHNAEDEVVADDVVNQQARAARVGNEGIVEENLKMPAVTTPSQAERLAEQFLRDLVNTRWMVEFTCAIQGLPLQPYDIIDVTHPSQPAWSGKLFRIEEINHDEEDRIMVKALEYVEHTPI